MLLQPKVNALPAGSFKAARSTMKTATTQADKDELRAMLKELLAEVLPDGAPRLGDGAGDGTPPKLGVAPLNPNRPDTPDNDFVHGVKGAVKYGVLNSTTGAYTFVKFDVEQITLDDEVDTDDITNTSSGGGQVILDGIQKISGTITFVWDSLNVFLVGGNAAMPQLRPRTYIYLQVLPDGVTVGAKFCALISGYSYGTGPKANTVRVACKYMSTGPITYPTVSQTTPTPALTS